MMRNPDILVNGGSFKMERRGEAWSCLLNARGIRDCLGVEIGSVRFAVNFDVLVLVSFR